jgi:hypothetical protein
MAQHDYVIENQTGAQFRADLNNVLTAIQTINSGTTEPTASIDYQLWHDTTLGALKQRHSGSYTGLRIFQPRIFNGILDANGNKMITFTATAAAVNDLTIANNTTGQPIKFNATSSVDTNVGMAFFSQGNSSERALLRLTATAVAVNEFTIANSATGNAPTLSVTGTDTNIDITITPKGAGSLTISGSRAVRIPSGATTDRPSSPINGMLRFNTTTSLLEIYNGATLAWEPLSPGVVSAAGSAASPAVTLSTDTDTGIYWSAANELAITTGGTQRVRIRDSAMLIPVGTTAQRPASPVNGEMRYNTSIGAPEFYNSTAAEWQFPAVMANVGSGTNTLRAIFGYGYTGSNPGVSMTNLVSNAGVVATDTTGVGTARYNLAAAGYGGDKAIFGYGYTGSNVSITNLVSNTGTVASDTTGVGTARQYLAAAGYGGDKAIFGYGTTGSNVSMTNLVSNAGIVANDVTGVGTARQYLAAAGYGGDKAIFGYGYTGSNPGVSMTNLVSNAGVVAADVTGVGTARHGLAAAGYGGDKAIFGYGTTGSGNVNMTNLVSNAGVVATDTTGVGTARYLLAAAVYGGDKAIFGYGIISSHPNVSMTNLVSNTGVVASDVTGVGTGRSGLAAAGYST